jgi:hypothetical protein
MKRLSLLAGLVFIIVSAVVGQANAQYSSNNYSANEVFFGSGGDTNQSSANYKASVSAGALGVGQTSSANYQAYSGFLTPNEPFLEMDIDTPLVDLGVLDTTTTNTGTANFRVRAYIDSGYTVQTVSQPPSYTATSGTYTLTGMSTQAAPTTGTEQFGINLTGPNNLGAGNFGSSPSPQPNSAFANGVAAPGYDTVNQFKYVVGDTIVQTPAGSSGWGQTNYTISYVANTGAFTPAGSYRMIHDLVVVATY